MSIKSIQAKIMVCSAAALLLTSAIIVTYSTMISYRDSMKSAREYATSVAESYANQTRAPIEAALDAATTLSQTFSAVKDPDVKLAAGRDEVKAILGTILNANPHFTGIFTCWEKDAFDGMDKGFAKQEGHDDTGRLIFHWSRDRQGRLRLEPLKGYEESGKGDYYMIPRKTLQSFVSDPYSYRIGESDELIVSVAAPIRVKNTFFGVVGVNLKVDLFQEMVSKANIYGGTGKPAILSNQRRLVGVMGSPDLLGKPSEAYHQALKADERFARISKGEKVFEYKDGELWILSPIQIDKIAAPWFLSMRIPEGQVTEAARKGMLYQTGISIACVLLALVVLFIMSRSIARPIYGVVAGLREASEKVASAAVQVSSASQSLAGGASQQAASIEETSSSLEEISSMTKQNAEHSGQADSLMKSANQVVSKANEAMGELTTSMEEISKASEETQKIVKTIDEIAFQTNLLALNAAVEAARAGEAGAGFAVVAGEVRNLAMRAADAAKSTANLIEGTVKKVKGGYDLVTKTNEAFVEVANASGKVGELVAEIAAASDEQSRGIGQVNKAVAEMDKVVQQNAAHSEESASSSEEMKAQAEQMKLFVLDLATLVGGKRAQEEVLQQ